MKNKMTLFFWFASFFVATNIYAQRHKITGDPKDFAMLKQRTLIVEVRDAHPDWVRDPARSKEANRIEYIKEFLSNNNDMLKKAVDKYWKLNAKIEYRNSSDLKDISKSNDYVILSFQLLDGGPPSLYYDRCEKDPSKLPDYDITIPYENINAPGDYYFMQTYLQCDYDFAVIEMQANIEYMIQTNERLTFEEYAKKMAEMNCAKYKNDTLVVDKMHADTSIRDINPKRLTYPLVMTDSKTYNDAFVNRQVGKKVIFTYYYKMEKQVSGSFETDFPVYSRVGVDCNTGDIVYQHDAGNASSFYIYYYQNFYITGNTIHAMKDCDQKEK